ncbi:MAG: hypothetical protein WCD47_21860 [Candidatus Sulfotelmatobacter sp.]
MSSVGSAGGVSVIAVIEAYIILATMPKPMAQRKFRQAPPFLDQDVKRVVVNA